MIKLVPIPHDALEQTAPTWLPFIHRIAERAKDHPGHLVQKIAAGEIHIAIAWNTEERKAEALCGIRVFLRGDERVAEIVWLTGKGRARYWPMGARIRAVDQGPDGSIYLLEDGNSGGRLLRLRPR